MASHSCFTQCGKCKKYSNLNNISWNQFTLWFVRQQIDFTEFCLKSMRVKFLNFSYCVLNTWSAVLIWQRFFKKWFHKERWKEFLFLVKTKKPKLLQINFTKYFLKWNDWWIKNMFDFFVKSKFIIFPWNGNYQFYQTFFIDHIIIFSLPNLFRTLNWTYFGTLEYKDCTVIYVPPFYVGVNYNLTTYVLVHST